MSAGRAPQTDLPGYADGDRHGWLDTLCGRLERIAVGKDAEQLLQDPAAPGSRRGLVTLPMWAWVPAGHRAGRKGRALHGGTLMLPVRIVWDETALTRVVSGEPTAVGWKGQGQGRTLRGSTVLTASARLRDPSDTLQAGVPEVLNGRPVGARLLRKQLTDLVEDGRAAWWEVVMDLEPWVDRSLRRAVSQMSNEFRSATGSTDPDAVPNGHIVTLSETSLETISTRLLLGSKERAGTVERLINACLRQNFSNVDPLKFIRVWLSRDALEAVRAGVDDPKVGAKVRRVMEASGATTYKDLIEAYNAIYPKDQLGIGRAERSILVGTDPMATVVNIDDLEVDQDHGRDHDPVLLAAQPPEEAQDLRSITDRAA